MAEIGAGGGGIPFTLTINWDRDRKTFDFAKRYFRVQADIVKDLTTFWTYIAPQVGADVAKNFQSQGEGAWRGISPKWIARKMDEGRDFRILHYRLRLRKAATMLGARGNIFVASRIQMIWGVDPIEIPYASIHNWGGVVNFRPHTKRMRIGAIRQGRAIGRGGQGRALVFPARKFMKLTRPFQMLLGRLWATWYQSKVSKQGLGGSGEMTSRSADRFIGGIP